MFQSAGFRGKMAVGCLIREVLQNYLVFGQQLPIVQKQGRNVALGIDVAKNFPCLRFAAREVDPDQIEGNGGLAQDDMAGQGAGGRSVEQFHCLGLVAGVMSKMRWGAGIARLA